MGHKNSEQENLELIQGVRSGDRKAEQRLYDLYCEVIEFLVTGKIFRRDEAADLCQDVWKAVFEAIKNDRIREPEKLPAFIRGICSNKIHDWIRAKYKPNPDRLEEEVIDESNGGPENVLLAKERRQQLARALRKLRPKDRKLIFLCYFRELSYRETAERFGAMTADAAKAATHRARKKLGYWLGKFGYLMALPIMTFADFIKG